ncbi:MAG TPA: NUDIX domain-containing protein [Rhizomicrobium sp.]|jgi:ADP-ribose pyrophosphatase YjhB (NUDIX family)|nr:NUDIX domain-containing protein [Rhizomicrobium sp.]
MGFEMGDRPPFYQRIALGGLAGLRAAASPVAFGASAMVENGSGQVLLVRHSYIHGWALPGGGVARREPPAQAVMRELQEEVGLRSDTAPELFGLYTRKLGWTTNVIALYRVSEATIDFKPNFEIREVLFCDPGAPPPGTTDGTRRRLAELTGAPRSHYW